MRFVLIAIVATSAVLFGIHFAFPGPTALKTAEIDLAVDSSDELPNVGDLVLIEDDESMAGVVAEALVANIEISSSPPASLSPHAFRAQRL